MFSLQQIVAQYDCSMVKNIFHPIISLTIGTEVQSEIFDLNKGFKTIDQNHLRVQRPLSTSAEYPNWIGAGCWEVLLQFESQTKQIVTL